MSRVACSLAFCALLAFTGCSALDSQQLGLLRILVQKPWSRWEAAPEIHAELDEPARVESELDTDTDRAFYEDSLKESSDKRSAVGTALNSGRRRRQPAPALGKVVTPYVGVGVLNDVGSFFDSLRDNLETLASLTPQQRAVLFQDTPNVVQASSQKSGGGSVFNRVNALRPLRPTNNIRSYNRRSFVEADGVYPGANHHDPALLWTGLGKR